MKIVDYEISIVFHVYYMRVTYVYLTHLTPGGQAMQVMTRQAVPFDPYLTCSRCLPQLFRASYVIYIYNIFVREATPVFLSNGINYIV